MPEKAFISLGSNIDPHANLPRAVEHLAGLGQIAAVSRVYLSPAVGRSEQPDFLNTAVLLLTPLDPHELRSRLRNIEADMGRIRKPDKNAPRVIDLDLCLYGDLMMTADSLVVPHPELSRRAYVAVPVSELDPEYVHPVLRQPLRQIADRLRQSCRLIERPGVVLHDDRKAPTC